MVLLGIFEQCAPQVFRFAADNGVSVGGGFFGIEGDMQSAEDDFLAMLPEPVGYVVGS